MTPIAPRLGRRVWETVSIIAAKCALPDRPSRFPYGMFPKTTWNLYAPRSHLAGMTSITLAPDAVAEPTTHHGARDRLPILMLGAIGVVYGDIGTSPLYAMKESFIGPHPMSVDRLHIFGVLSLIFWSLMLIVTVKYVAV